MRFNPEGLDNQLDPVGIYLNQIGRYSLLTRQQEVNLAKRIKAGSVYADKGKREVVSRTPDAKEAADEMTNCNLKMVVSIAKGYAKKSRVPLSDLVSVGNIGLMLAVNKYDHRRGNRFSTCAYKWIESHIQELAYNGNLIKTPAHRAGAYSKINGLINKGMGFDEACRKRRLTENQKQALIHSERARAIYSLNCKYGHGEDSFEFGEHLSDNKALSPDKSPRILERENKEYLESILGNLSIRERDILKMRHIDGLLLKEVGKTLGITAERVRQVQKRALKRVRKKLAEESCLSR